MLEEKSADLAAGNGNLGINHDPELLRTLLDSLGDGVYYTDKSRRIHFWNRAAEELTGYSAEEVIGRKCADNILSHVDEKGTCICTSGNCPLVLCFKGAPRNVDRVYLHHKAGHRVPVRVCATPVRDASGEIIGGMECFHDISSEMAALREIKALKETALLCHLTGVGNRRLCEQVLETTLREQEPECDETGLLFFDVDNFKSINDTYGHQIGDVVLKMVANTVARDLRGNDFLGRWGGEEFIAILPGMRRHALEATAERLRRLVAACATDVSGGILGVTVSIGATLCGFGETPDAVLERADALMYQSKTSGKNKVTLG